MEKQLKKVLFITNIPAPYRVDFYNELGKVCDLTVIYEAKRAPGITFNWKEDAIKYFRAIFLKEGEIKEKRVDWNIFYYIKQLEYDAIFVTNYAYFTEMVALFGIKLRGIPYYYELDGAMVHYQESSLVKAFKSFFLKGAKAYISPSAVSDKYVKYYAGEHAKVIRYPFSSLWEQDILSELVSEGEKVILRKKLGVKESKMILAVGQFIHRKGFDVLMEAARDMDKQIGIYIVGGEPTDEYLYIQKEYGLTQVHFEGFKAKDKLAEYFMAADLFVLPTREDIWGLVINEAMAYGLPVVTTNKCVAGMELLQDKECLIGVDDAEQLSDIMRLLINNDNLRYQIAQHNLDKITGYTIEKMVKVHIDIINEL